MTFLTSIIVFILGTAIGSFLSVVVHRTKKGKKGILLSRSICPSCKKKIKWKHLIPVFSWVFLQGKCSYCKKTISFHYLLLEILTGLIFVATFLNWNFIEVIPALTNPGILNYSMDWQIFQIFLFYIVTFSFLIAIFFYDLKYKEIPDRFSLPAIAIAIAGGIVFNIISPLTMLIGGLAVFVFFFLQFLISKGTWIGGGDLRMGALIGVLLGWEKGLLAVIISYFIGAILSIYLLATKRVGRKSTIPFGPFLVIGTIISLFYGQCILDWYLTTLLF